MGNDFGALLFEVAIALPAVVMSARIDHPPYRFGGNFFYCVMDLPCRLKSGAAIDQHGSLLSQHQAQIRIQALVPDSARSGVANIGIYAICHGLECNFERDSRLNKERKSHCHQCKARPPSKLIRNRLEQMKAAAQHPFTRHELVARECANEPVSRHLNFPWNKQHGKYVNTVSINGPPIEPH